MEVKVVLILLMVGGLQDHAVNIYAANGALRGRGTAIGSEMVITANHVVSYSAVWRVRGLRAVVIWRQPRKDIAYLLVRGIKVPPAKLGGPFKRKETVQIVNRWRCCDGEVMGFWIAHTRAGNTHWVRKIRCKIFRGESGSGVFDSEGRLVGVVSGTIEGWCFAGSVR